MTKTMHSPKGGGSYLARAHDRWKGAAPDWVVALAKAADAETDRGGSQATLGKRLEMKSTIISAILGNKYPGKLDRYEATVKGALMSATVECPALGAQIGRDECMSHQQRKQFSASSPQMVKLAKECRRCPNNVGAKP